jgi:hypothetical protein
MTDSAVRLLELSRAILAGDIELPAGRAARCAAVLARSAIEEIVPRLCAQTALDVENVSTRVQLACLRSLDPGRGGVATVAWMGLSRACHQHAYELAPQKSEVEHLVSLVDQLGTG